MALIEPYLQKYASLIGPSGTTLTARSGESLLVTDLHVYGAANSYVEILIDKVSSGFFRVGGTQGNHLPYRQKALATDTGAITSETGLCNCDQTLIGLMRQRGWFAGYPVAEGQTITVREYGSSSPTASLLIEYQKYEADDVQATQPNGSDSKSYVYVSYGRPGSALAVDTTTQYTASANPAEYPAFPWTGPVPSNRTFRLLGIAGSPAAVTGDASNYGIRTQYLKLIRDRTVLYDDERNGLVWLHKTPAGSADAKSAGPGYSAVGGYSSVDRNTPFIPTAPLEFGPGEELDVYVTTEHVGSTAGTPKTLAVGDVEVGLIISVEAGE